DGALFADLPWKLAHSPVRATLGPALTYVGHRSLPFGQTSDAYLLFDAALRFDWRRLELSFIGTNLLDARYRLSEFTFVSDFHTQPEPTLMPERAFTAGAPRMLFLSLSATLGG
ncbi:MAG TPA: TonB-dependent receptor, partial [Polyangiaceae bacterium]|nr:TonB-dependent receptor [Polyangiaceae bacterium]